MPALDPSPPLHPVANIAASRAAAPSASPRAIQPPDDGTHALLKAGAWILLTALAALAATRFLFGGIGITGPHTNSGWLAFMYALMGVPFSLMLLVLGGAKWLRNRRPHR
jgi:hypothetical protein